MKILPVFLHFDYGIKSRGETIEYKGGGWYSSLKQLGYDVYPFWWDDYKENKEELQKLLIEYSQKVQPDIILFILMRDEFSYETLDILKEKYTTINWFWDDHWRFENFTKHYAPHFTYSVTTDKYSLPKYKSIGYKNVILSRGASSGYIATLDFDRVKYQYDISFVGGYSAFRGWLVKQLKKQKIHIECFGVGWKNGIVQWEKMNEIFLTSRINLNISNSVSYDVRYIFSHYRNIKEFLKSDKRVEQLKQRNFEIPAFGGFQLTNYVPALEDYFDIGKEVVVYTGLEDLILKLNYYLENEDIRKNILANGHKRVLKDGPTYVERFKEIFVMIDK
ncbi:glycosyltransferase [bacterium]|nr:glycosyltransferase [bacterium]